jgi:hypothetical protein
MVVVITNNLNIRAVDLRHVRLAISDKKNYSEEDGIEDGTKGLFWLYA